MVDPVEVAVTFNPEGWRLLNLTLRTLYWEVMLETWGLLMSLDNSTKHKTTEPTTDHLAWPENAFLQVPLTKGEFHSGQHRGQDGLSNLEEGFLRSEIEP
jgi:KRAB domain-containing zinc finger protein